MTDTMTTAIAPKAMEKNSVCGTIRTPTSAMTTVAPLKNTVRFAVAPVRATASRLLSPRANSSRKRDTTNSE